MEFIEINGMPVQVPQEIVSQGRDAVAAWAAQQAPSSFRSSSLSAAPSAPQE